MTSDATLTGAVISGLAVGIGFVVTFSIFFTPSLNGNCSSSAVPIEDARRPNVIDFTVALTERDMVGVREMQGGIFEDYPRL